MEIENYNYIFNFGLIEFITMISAADVIPRINVITNARY